MQYMYIVGKFLICTSFRKQINLILPNNDGILCLSCNITSSFILLLFLTVALHDWGTRKVLLDPRLNNTEFYMTPLLITQLQDKNRYCLLKMLLKIDWFKTYLILFRKIQNSPKARGRQLHLSSAGLLRLPFEST